MWTDLAGWQKTLTVLLAILGILAIAAGIVYFAEPAHALPSFFPAHSHSNKHATKHGIVALVVGVILLVVAVIIPYTVGRRRY